MNEQELQKAFMAYLIEDAAAQGMQIQSEQDLQAYAQQLGEEGLKAKYQEFMQKMQGGVKAALGAKLDYINKLKGNCPEGEELVYMKEGGRVCPKCIKKAQKGTQTPKKEEKKNPVQDFKAKRKKLDPKTTKKLPNGKYPSDWDGNDRMVWEREHGSHDEGAHVVKNKGIKKNLCGGKTKKK